MDTLSVIEYATQDPGPLLLRGELVLELTDRCHLACLHCSSSSGSGSRAELPAPLVFRLLAEARELGVTRVSFGGGEPTTSALLAEAVRFAGTRFSRINVYTCGARRVDDGSVLPLATDLLEHWRGLEALRLIFSIHGSSREIHDAVTLVPGSFDAMIASARLARDLEIHTETHFVPMSPNADELESVVRLASRLGSSKVSILRFVAQGRGAQSARQLQLNAADEQRFLVKLSALRARRAMPIRTGSPWNGRVSGPAVPCRAGRWKLVVQPTGNVVPCEVFKAVGRRDFGLSANEHTLGALYRLAERAMATDWRTTPGCSRCPFHG